MVVNQELIRMQGICKYFPGVKALEDVSLSVRAGEVHALLGENGAGKSTLIKILNGVYTPDEGEIFVRGEKVVIRDIRDAQRLRIGIIFQETNLCPDLSVADNVFIGRHKRNALGWVDKKHVEEKTQEILDRMAITSIKPTDIVRRMSVSQMQMVEIAKALSMDSDLLVFDEPTAALTEAEIEKLFSIIRDLCAQGKGIIYISHRMEELSCIAHSVTVLRDGKKIGETFRFADKSMDELISMMVGRELKDKYPVYQRNIGEPLLTVKSVKSRKLQVEQLQVRKGEIVGISGLVGAGRTELARAIFGADRVEEIHIELAGKQVVNRSPSDALKHGIAYITEDRKREGLAMRMDLEKNINMASWGLFQKVGFVNNRQALVNAKQQLQKLQIKTPSMRQVPFRLSGGNQQKVVLAKWLSRETSVIIFDEPTRGIDVGVKYEIYKIMNMLSDQGVGIIMISSELPEILGMSDRIYTMYHGKINGELDTKDATQESILRYIVGVESSSAKKE